MRWVFLSLVIISTGCVTARSKTSLAEYFAEIQTLDMNSIQLLRELPDVSGVRTGVGNRRHGSTELGSWDNRASKIRDLDQALMALEIFNQRFAALSDEAPSSLSLRDFEIL